MEKSSVMPWSSCPELVLTCINRRETTPSFYQTIALKIWSKCCRTATLEGNSLTFPYLIENGPKTRCVGQHTGALSSLLEVLNFEKKHVDDTASAEGVGEFIDHDEPLVDQVSTSLQDEENNEINVTVESPEISVRSSNIPKRALVMFPKVVKYNHDPSPNLNKKVKVINPEATDSNIKCDYCEMSFKYKQTLNRHVKEFHLDKTDLFVCESCNFVFRRKENLQRHILKTCLKKLNLVYKCKNCKLMFDNEVKLNTHVEKNCTKKYLCITCLKYFKKKKDFLSHDH